MITVESTSNIKKAAVNLTLPQFRRFGPNLFFNFILTPTNPTRPNSKKHQGCGFGDRGKLKVRPEAGRIEGAPDRVSGKVSNEVSALYSSRKKRDPRACLEVGIGFAI